MGCLRYERRQLPTFTKCSEDPVAPLQIAKCLESRCGVRPGWPESVVHRRQQAKIRRLGEALCGNRRAGGV